MQNAMPPTATAVAQPPIWFEEAKWRAKTGQRRAKRGIHVS
jgi:hypothetical protein